MRKIILGVAVSLDGLIEGPNGEYDWCFTDQDYGIKDFLKRIDALFVGRKTYEMAGGNLFPDKTAYVFSNTLKKVAENEVLINGDVASQVKEIKSKKGKDIWLFGGASLTTELMNHKLVDELWLSVHPIVLGSGKPLFQNILNRVHTKLIDTKTYPTGLVSMRYSVNTE